MKIKKIALLLFVTAAALITAGCNQDTKFSVIKDVKPASEGFVTTDQLQMTGVGYPDPATLDPAKRQEEARLVAVTRARMNVLDFVFEGIKANATGQDDPALQSYMKKVGRFSSARYGRKYSQDFVQGKSKIDSIYQLLELNGYVKKWDWNASSGKYQVVYVVVKAGLMGYAKRGFDK